MADPKPEETFKVVNRRLFTEQGELRKGAVEEERRNEEAAKKNASASAAKKSVSQDAPSATGADPSAATPAAEEPEPSHSFQLLVDFLTRNAAAMMGGMADPRTGKAFVDLEGAREM